MSPEREVGCPSDRKRAVDTAQKFFIVIQAGENDLIEIFIGLSASPTGKFVVRYGTATKRCNMKKGDSITLQARDF